MGWTNEKPTYRRNCLKGGGGALTVGRFKGEGGLAKRGGGVFEGGWYSNAHYVIASETPTCITAIQIVTHIFAAETVTCISAPETSNCIILTETITYIIATERSNITVTKSTTCIIATGVITCTIAIVRVSWIVPTETATFKIDYRNFHLQKWWYLEILWVTTKKLNKLVST